MTLDEITFAGDSLRALVTDFNEGHMPPATLFSGESGIGKKRTARLFAKGLVCLSKTGRPCGECRACLRFEAGTHSSVLRPDADADDKTVKIDDMRRLIDQLSRHSLEGGARAVLIENAERLTPQAQNCLLKTLEECGGDTFFLLTADSETALLATVRSRCRVVRMQPWSDARMLATLQESGVPDERAKELIALCGGSIGRALKMQGDESYWEARDTVRDTFLSLESADGIPRAAKTLTARKDDARLMDILEEELSAMLRGAAEKPPALADADGEELSGLLDRVVAARRMRQQNVSWAAVSDRILRYIAEEKQAWQA